MKSWVIAVVLVAVGAVAGGLVVLGAGDGDDAGPPAGAEPSREGSFAERPGGDDAGDAPTGRSGGAAAPEGRADSRPAGEQGGGDAGDADAGAGAGQEPADDLVQPDAATIQADDLPAWIARLADIEGTDPEERQAAMDALSSHGAAGPHADTVQEAWLATARRDPSLRLRTRAVSCLVGFGGEAGVRAVMDIARTDDDPRVRSYCLRSLGRLAKDRYWAMWRMTLSNRHKMGRAEPPPPTDEEFRRTRDLRTTLVLRMLDSRAVSAPTEREREDARRSARQLARALERLREGEASPEDDPGGD